MEIMGQLRPDQSRAVKPMIVMLLLLLIIFQCVSATNHTVGGPSGWNVASDMKKWQANTLFVIGDNLVFVYKPDEKVIEVNERDYAECEIGSPIHAYGGGNTVVPLAKRGTRYFVSGKPTLCFHGLKIQIDVFLPHQQRRSPPLSLRRYPPPPCQRRSPPLPLRRYPLPPGRAPMSPSYVYAYPPSPNHNGNGGLLRFRAYLIHYWYVLVMVLGFGGSMFWLFRVKFMCMCESCCGCITSLESILKTYSANEDTKAFDQFNEFDGIL